MGEFQDIRLAFGESDEYSFVLPKDCVLYGAAPGRGAVLAARRAPLDSFW